MWKSGKAYYSPQIPEFRNGNRRDWSRYNKWNDNENRELGLHYVYDHFTGKIDNGVKEDISRIAKYVIQRIY
jgi:hypothetical protein